MTNSPDDPEGNLLRPKFGVISGGGGNRIELMVRGGFMVFWRGQVVYENGRIKRFLDENIARVFLERCDRVGKIIH
jgi:hypothetical protein